MLPFLLLSSFVYFCLSVIYASSINHYGTFLLSGRHISNLTDPKLKFNAKVSTFFRYASYSSFLFSRIKYPSVSVWQIDFVISLISLEECTFFSLYFDQFERIGHNLSHHVTTVDLHIHEQILYHSKNI